MTSSAASWSVGPGSGPGSGRWRALGLSLLVLALILAACEGSEEATPPAPEIISRETFVSAYVDLRMAALRDTGSISPEERERILETHGITPTDLLEFVEVYGEDPVALQEVWSDVRDRIREAREEAAVAEEEEEEESDGP